MQVVTTDLLSLPTIWDMQGPDVWKASGVKDVENIIFYPVFQFEDCYSYHPLFLIVQKGFLRVNPRILKGYRGRRYYSGNETIDQDVRRIGGVPRHTPSYYDKREFIADLASAMTEDIRRIESAYPEHEQIVLCGGRDSMNILLLPWSRPVTVLSAEPNYPLVREFVERNELAADVHRLEDLDRGTLDDEILFNMNHNDLRHYRWTGELKRLANERDGKVIFWKGQLADTFLTPYWRKYVHFGDSRPSRFATRVGNKLQWYSTKHLVRRWIEAQWLRGAMWQGFHMSFLRSICGALFLSAYHGPRTAALIPRIYPPAVCDTDIRPDIGRQLTGTDVWYPTANPTPIPSSLRTAPEGTFDRFLELIRRHDVRVEM